MTKNKILTGDCFELIKEQPDNSVDLIITSPPYADIVNYGKVVSIKKPKDYVDWILPLFKEIQRVLKPCGSFILNINDMCANGYRSTYIYELIYRSQKETKLKFYDQYIWHKRNGIPNGSKKRFRNNTEFIFHFVKDRKHLKFYMDRVLQEPAESYLKRLESPINNDTEIIDGERKRNMVKRTVKTRYSKNITDGKQDHIYKERIVPDKVRPDNVFRFLTAAASRDNEIRHPAPYHKELPSYFINLLTDEGDLVLDVFNGIGTTCLSAQELNRNWLGFEMNEKYAEFSRQKLQGEDISVLPKYKIAQYDMDDNFIQVFHSIGDIEKYFGKPCQNNIKNILRQYKRNFTLWGYKWKLVDEDKGNTSI